MKLLGILAMQKYFLIVEGTLIEEKVFPLETQLTIGRAPGNDIKLAHASVSRQHALVDFNMGKPTLEDRSSTNGTFVNGERVDVATLSNGDKLRVGSVYLRFFHGDHPPMQLSDEDDTVTRWLDSKEERHYQVTPNDLEQMKTVKYELEKAGQIQKGFLPDQVPTLKNWEIATYFHPAHQVAGDFYDAFLLPGDYLGLVIADVCDKGVGSALYMSMIRSLVRVFSGETLLKGFTVSAFDRDLHQTPLSGATTDPEQFKPLRAVELTNDYIASEHGHMHMFATLFFGVLNPNSGIMTYINGGHEPLFVVGSDGLTQSIDATGPAVGIMPGMKFRAEQTRLQPGEILFGYTDGVVEAQTPSGDLFTRKRLVSLLDGPEPSGSDLLERIKTEVFAHTGQSQLTDDITMITLQRKG
jgi:serine phosphatase RsbU (regulator of sigma subunit)